MIILNSKNWKKLRWNSNRLLLVCVISLFNFINTEELLTEEETEFCTQTAFHKLSQRRYVSSRKMTWVKAQACCELRQNFIRPEAFAESPKKERSVFTPNEGLIRIDFSQKFFWIHNYNTKNPSYCSDLYNEKESSVYDAELLRPCVEERYFICHTAELPEYDLGKSTPPKTQSEGGKTSLAFEILWSNKQFNYFIAKDNGANSPALLTWLEATALIQDKEIDGIFLDLENIDDIYFLENIFSLYDKTRNHLTWIHFNSSKRLKKLSKWDHLNFNLLDTGATEDWSPGETAGTNCGAVGFIDGRANIIRTDCFARHFLIVKRKLQTKEVIVDGDIYQSRKILQQANKRSRRQTFVPDIPAELSSSEKAMQNAQWDVLNADTTLNQNQIPTNQQPGTIESTKNESQFETAYESGPLPQALHASMLGLLYKKLQSSIQAGNINQSQSPPMQPDQTPISENDDPSMQQQSIPNPMPNNGNARKAVPSSRGLGDNDMLPPDKLRSTETDDESTSDPPEIYENTEAPLNQPKPEPVQQRSLFSDFLAQSAAGPAATNLLPSFSAPTLGNNLLGGGGFPNFQTLFQPGGGGGRTNQDNSANNNPITENPSSSTSFNSFSTTQSQLSTQPQTISTIPDINNSTNQNSNLSPTTNTDSSTPSSSSGEPEVMQEPVQQKSFFESLFGQASPQAGGLFSGFGVLSLGNGLLGGIPPKINQGSPSSAAENVPQNESPMSSDIVTTTTAAPAPANTTQNVSQNIPTTNNPTADDLLSQTTEGAESEEVQMSRDEYDKEESSRLLSLDLLGKQSLLSLPFQRGLNKGGVGDQLAEEENKANPVVLANDGAIQVAGGDKPPAAKKEENKSCSDNPQCKECSELLERTKKLHIAVEKLLAKLNAN